MGTNVYFHQKLKGLEGSEVELEVGTTSFYSSSTGTTIYMKIGDDIDIALSPQQASTLFEAMDTAHTYLSEILPKPGDPIDTDLI